MSLFSCIVFSLCFCRSLKEFTGNLGHNDHNLRALPCFSPIRDWDWLLTLRTGCLLSVFRKWSNSFSSLVLSNLIKSVIFCNCQVLLKICGCKPTSLWNKYWVSSYRYYNITYRSISEMWKVIGVILGSHSKSLSHLSVPPLSIKCHMKGLAWHSIGTQWSMYLTTECAIGWKGFRDLSSHNWLKWFIFVSFKTTWIKCCKTCHSLSSI